MRIPRISIADSSYKPGMASYMPVTITEHLDHLGANASRTFLLDVPLDRARLIVECVEHCRQNAQRLESIARMTE